jgi:hypothetical protein
MLGYLVFALWALVCGARWFVPAHVSPTKGRTWGTEFSLF